MTQDEIIRMAREAGIETDWSFDFKIRLERFAALVAAHEREKHGSPSWDTVADALAAEIERVKAGGGRTSALQPLEKGVTNEYRSKTN